MIRINNTIGIKIIPKNHGKYANTNATILLITSAMPHPAKIDMVTAVVKMKADKNTIHRCSDIFFLASLEDFMCSRLSRSILFSFSLERFTASAEAFMFCDALSIFSF